MCSVAFCCPSSFCFSLSCSLCVLIWVSLVRSRVTLLLLFLGQVSFRRLLVAGKTLIFQFVAEFSVIFLLPQFGARSVVVVSLCVFFLSRCFFLLLPCSFFFALQLFGLRFSFPRFVVVSFVQCNKFHLTANEGTRHPPTATDGLLPPLSFSLSLLLLLLRLVAAAFSSCGLRFVVCYLFLFSMRSLLFALPIMRCTHSQTPTHTQTHTTTAAYSCIHSYIYMRPGLCVCSAICVCLFARVCLCFLFHFTLSALMLVLFLLLLLLFALRLWLAQINWNISKMSAEIYPICVNFWLELSNCKGREGE